MTLQFPPGLGVAPPELLRTMSGFDFLQAILDGRLPHPPIMVTLGYGPVELAPGRVVFEAQLDGRAYNPIDASGKLCGWASSTCMIMPL